MAASKSRERLELALARWREAGAAVVKASSAYTSSVRPSAAGELPADWIAAAEAYEHLRLELAEAVSTHHSRAHAVAIAVDYWLAEGGAS